MPMPPPETDMTDHCKLITRHPEDFERMINQLEASLHNAQLEIERQAGVIVHDTKVYGQIIQGHEKRIAELEAALRDTTWQDHADHWKKRAERLEAALREIMRRLPRGSYAAEVAEKALEAKP